MGKADVYLCTADHSLFYFFPFQLCPWTLGWDLLILPIPSMVSGSYYPTHRKPISTLPTDICPQAIKSPTPKWKPADTHHRTALTVCERSFYSVPWKKQFQQNTQQFCSSVFSSLSLLFKMWTESGFYLISDLVQAHISNTSGTISVMNCRWSY